MEIIGTKKVVPGTVCYTETTQTAKGSIIRKNKFNVATLMFMSNREEQVSYIPVISLSWEVTPRKDYLA